ncbi:hypothetical protein L249_0925, partial [Ophiocordyceps polyrhachis-furcata BCC 54312]
EARYEDTSIGASPDTISPALVSLGIDAACLLAPEGEAAGQEGEGGEGGLELFIVWDAACVLCLTSSLECRKQARSA